MAGGLPTSEITAVIFDAPTGHLFVTSTATSMLWETPDQGVTWLRVGDTGFGLLSAALAGNRLFAATAFNGLITAPEASAAPSATQ